MRDAGRNHKWEFEAGKRAAEENAWTIVEGVKGRGIFKTRKPEGKAGDH